MESFLSIKCFAGNRFPDRIVISDELFRPKLPTKHSIIKIIVEKLKFPSEISIFLSCIFNHKFECPI